MKRQRKFAWDVAKQHQAKKRRTAAPALKRQNAVVGYQSGRALLGQPAQELKAFDVATAVVASSTIAGPPTFQLTNGVANGSELYQRVGRKIYMKSLRFRATLAPNAVANEGQQRLIIYYDANPNGAAPAMADILLDANAAAATTSYSEINLNNRSRFKIIRDTQWLVGQATNIAGATEIVPDPIKESMNVDYFIPLNGLETVFNATGGGLITSINTGALGWVIFGDANAADYSLTVHTRLRYYD